MRAPNPDDLRELYETWSSAELKNALNHKSDYRSEAIKVIHEVLAARKVAPVRDRATVDHREGFALVQINSSHVRLPSKCAKCLKRPEVKVEVRSDSRVTWIGGLSWATQANSIAIPFCKDCATRRIRTRWLVIYSLMVLVTLAALPLAIAVVLWIILAALLIYGIHIEKDSAQFFCYFDDPKVVSIFDYDDGTITFRILNETWASEMAAMNNLAETIKN